MPSLSDAMAPSMATVVTAGSPLEQLPSLPSLPPAVQESYDVVATFLAELPVAVKVAGGIVSVSLLTYAASRKVRRAVYFWKESMPILVAYKWNERKVDKGHYKSEKEITDSWNKLHDKYAPKAYNLLTTLKGVYLKLGQIYGSRRDVVPEQYYELLKQLQDACPTVDSDEICAYIEKNMGVKIADVFADFDVKPLASGSLAQVHRCQLQDGRQVVLKTQYPGAQELFRLDLRMFYRFSQMAAPEMSRMQQEFEVQILNEFNFVREARIMMRVRSNLAEEFPNIVVPMAIPDMVHRRVMVMEYLDGVNMMAGLMMSTPEQRREMIVTLIKAYGKMIFVDAVFQSDPHPGNYLLLKDGRIGLIDFGQSKELDDVARGHLCRVFLGIAKGDRQATIKEMHAMGFKSAKMGEATAWSMANIFFDSLPREDFLGEWIDISKNDGMTSFPGDLVLAFRVTMLFRGVCSAMGLTDVSTVQLMLPYVERACKLNGFAEVD